MSKFTEEWQELRKRIGYYVGQMDSMTAKYGDVVDVEDKAEAKGYAKGYEVGIHQIKDEICAKCKHKVTSELSCKYAGLLNDFDKLTYTQKDIVNSIIAEMIRKGAK